MKFKIREKKLQCLYTDKNNTKKAESDDDKSQNSGLQMREEWGGDWEEAHKEFLGHCQTFYFLIWVVVTEDVHV